MLDTTAWTAEQHKAAKEEFELYKEKLRPLIREADLYHISARPDGVHWDAIEYFDAAKGQGAVYAFRGSIDTEANHSFVLKGLQRGRRYRLHFQDQTSPDRDMDGKELLSGGLRVGLGTPNSSELIFFQEIAKPN